MRATRLPAGDAEPPPPAALVDLHADVVLLLSRQDILSFTWPLPRVSPPRYLVVIRRVRGPYRTDPMVTRHVVAHELGHALGLDHNAEPHTLMCGPCQPLDGRARRHRLPAPHRRRPRPPRRAARPLTAGAANGWSASGIVGSAGRHGASPPRPVVAEDLCENARNRSIRTSVVQAMDGMRHNGRRQRMRTVSIFVQAFWDDDAKVWVATSNDIEGLSVEGATHEELSDKVVAAVADLIELNGIDTDLSEIPVHIMTDDVRRVGNPRVA